MPTRFDEIFDQGAAIAQIRSAWGSNRLPHGLLFAGPTGVGKHATATALATLFLCEKPTKDGDPCGRCEACRGMATGTHPDYHFVERRLVHLLKDSKARDLSIDVVREYLNLPAGRKAVLGGGKVFVVDEADRMSTDAQNSLLKTLEEPPGRTLIILLSDQPEYLLPTIRSRTQLVRFNALPDDRVRKELLKRGIAAEDAADAARFSEGSLGQAMRWLEQGIVAAAREMIAGIDALPAGAAALSDRLQNFAKDFAEREVKRDEDTSADQAKREVLGVLLKVAANHFRRQLPQADPETAERLCARIEATVAAERYIDGNVTPLLAIEHLVAEWAATADRTPIATPTARPRA